MTSPRTVLIDLRAAQFNGDRGIPAYSQSLALELARGHSRHRWLLLYNGRFPLPGLAAELARHAAWCTVADLDGPAAPAVDVILSGCFFLGHTGSAADFLVPRAVRRQRPRRLGIVYDLVPLLFADRYLTHPVTRRQYLAALREMRHSDQLFAISHATRRDTIRYAAVDPRRVHCIYGDIDHEKRLLMARPAEETADVPRRHGLTGPYCLYVGGDDWRKNMAAAVQAFAIFHRDHPRHRLAIVCKLAAARIAELHTLAASLGLPRNAVECTGFVPAGDLVGLVRHAEMLVYPSLYEGLGLPVLEAYGCDTPVVGSNTSSVAELVLPELGCDPGDPASIAAAMARLAASDGLRAKSLAFGRQLMADELGWDRAAGCVMEHIETRQPGVAAAVAAAVAAVEPGRDQPRPAAAPRVAVVGVLPPVNSGIAPYTLRHLQDARWLTTFYAANGGARLEHPRGVVPPSRVLPAELLPAALARRRHDATVFVLGNSPHHIRVLEAMMRSRDMPGRRLLWLHEAGLDTIFRAWLGADADGLPSSEPPGDLPDWIARALAAKPKLSAGLRFLADHAAIDGLIVNSAACRDLVRAALGPRADVWSIDVAFLPIEEPTGASAPMAWGDGTLRVGSFGHAGDPKRLDCVAQAVGLLDRTRPARLVVAGWEVGRYCRRTGINRLGYVDVSDAPDDAGLSDCMRRVDVAVQLRTPTFGESSGVVNELVAIGTPLVVSRVGSFAELPANLVTFVESTCSPAELAAAITAAAATRPSETARASFLAARSHAAFAATFAAALAVQGLPATARDRAASCSPAAA